MRLDRTTLLAASIGWIFGGGCASLPGLSPSAVGVLSTGSFSSPDRFPLTPADLPAGCQNPGVIPPDLSVPALPPEPAPADPSPSEVPA